MIHLIHTKETFIKNLIKIGYNYKINQYDDLITSIRRIVSSQINTAIEDKNLHEKIDEIFGYDVPLIIIENSKKIEKIQISFLITLIDTGLLDLFLLENTRIASIEIQKKAYLKTLLDKLNTSSYIFYTLEKNNEKILDKQSSQYLTIKKCIDNNQIFITDDEKYIISYDLRTEIMNELLRRINFKFQNVYSNIAYSSLGFYEVNVGKLKEDILNMLLPEYIFQNDFPHIDIDNHLTTKYNHVDYLLKILNKRTGLSKANILIILRAIKYDDSSLLKNMKIFKDQRIEKNVWNTLKKQGQKVFNGFNEFKDKIKEYELIDIKDVKLTLTYDLKKFNLNMMDYLSEV